MNTYTPRPVNTADVRLPHSLTNLLEKLAENAHEVWAAERIKHGWTYGTARDDVAKKHPCLIAYGDLPESEKEYDRKAASETLRLILKLGYAIEDPKK